MWTPTPLDAAPPDTCRTRPRLRGVNRASGQVSTEATDLAASVPFAVLGLQRAAGNAATARYLAQTRVGGASRDRLSLARCGAEPCACSPKGHAVLVADRSEEAEAGMKTAGRRTASVQRGILELSVLGPVLAAQQAKLRALKKAFTFPFWELPDARKQSPKETSHGTCLMIDGIEVCFKPDRFLTDEEMAETGSSFKQQGITAGAVTSVTYDHLEFDTGSIQRMTLGTGKHMVTDYTEPVLTIAVQVTYRRSRRVRTLEAARRQISAYGRGRTLRDHEAAHVADAVSYIQSVGPRLPDGRGTEAGAFNRMIKSYYAAAYRIGEDYGDYTRARTDCPGHRNASFCPVVKQK